jgi:prepilin-type N-terminal cleavage/methylation domain-containing protein/prepilin-type processing-associated H-X9-DG protein
MSSLRRRDAGFTFIELLVVLLIGSALYAVALGPVRSYLEGKKRAGCAENLRKLHMVMVLYANEHDGAFPNAPGARSSDEAFALLVPKCTSDPSVFACAVSEKKEHYSYVMGLTREDSGPLAADSAAAHGKGPGNVLFTDGHIETFEPGAARMRALPPRAVLLEPRP